MVEITPHLTFNGDCEAAFKFYEQCFEGKISFMMTYGDSPMANKFPAELSKKVFHATFSLGKPVFSGNDSASGQYQNTQGITIALNSKAAAEADRVFAALAEGGTVQMPVQETFWALRFGQVTDRFGIPWMVNCEKPAQ